MAPGIAPERMPWGQPAEQPADQPTNQPRTPLVPGNARITFLIEPTLQLAGAAADVGHYNGVSRLAYDADAGRLYSGGRDGRLCAWDVDAADSQVRLATVGAAHTDWIADVAALGGGKGVLTASHDRRVLLWPGSGPWDAPVELVLHGDYVRCVAYAPDSGVAVSASVDRTFAIVDVADGRAVASFAAEKAAEQADGGRASSVFSLGVDAFGHLVAAGSADGIVRLYDPRAGLRAQARLLGHTDVVRGLALGQEGAQGALATGSSDRTLRLWDLRQPARSVATFRYADDSLWSVAAAGPGGPADGLVVGHAGGAIARVFAPLSGHATVAYVAQLPESAGQVTSIVRTGGASAVLWASSGRRGDFYAFQDVERGSVPALSVLLDAGDRVGADSTGNGLQLWLPRAEEKTGAAPLALVATAPPPLAGQRAAEYATETHCRGHRVPARSAALRAVRGAPAFVRQHLLNNRRHAVVLDAAGQVTVWDLLQLRIVKTLGFNTRTGSTSTFDEAVERFATVEWVAPWCSLDLTLGALAVRLDAARAGEAMVYLDAVSPLSPALVASMGDHRVNLGGWVLSNLLRAHLASDRLLTESLAEGSTVRLINGYPLLEIPASVPLLIDVADDAAAAPRPVARGTVGTLSDSLAEPEARLIPVPAWAVHWIVQGQTLPTPEQHKLFFALHPAVGPLVEPPGQSLDGAAAEIPEPAPLPELPGPSVRLSANRMLRTRKMLSYVLSKLEVEAPRVPASHYSAWVARQRSATPRALARAAAAAQGPSDELIAVDPEEVLELWCAGRRLLPDTTLATIRYRIWRPLAASEEGRSSPAPLTGSQSPDEPILYYRLLPHVSFHRPRHERAFLRLDL